MTDPPARVLVVDDDSQICHAYDEILHGHGYDVVTAGSAAEAFAALERLHGDVQVLVLDIALPDADGAELARDIAASIGQRPTLYVSGWTDDFWNLVDAPGRWLVMRKPIPIPQFLQAVDWLAGRTEQQPS